MSSTNVLPFHPLPLIGRPHLQTILASSIRLVSEPPSKTIAVAVDDGDELGVEISTPSTWRPEEPTVVLIHGLCGCHRSAYLVRMARKLYRRGVRAVRMNLRGCGSGRGLARRPYHSGQSGDALAVLNFLLQDTPASPTSLVGFSLGGNIALKLAGELGERGTELLQRVIAVCPPANLDACSALIDSPRNRLYSWHFVSILRDNVADRQRLFPSLPAVELPKRLTLRQFDELYTAPQCGFEDAADYYRQSSSAQFVPRISIPTTILFADDDPVIDTAVFVDTPLPRNVDVVHVANGGHMGFLGVPGSPGGYRWLDSQLLDWLEDSFRQGLIHETARDASN